MYLTIYFLVIILRFLPGSITDATYVFDQDLFCQWNIIQKQVPGISERSFLKALEEFSKQKGRVSTFISISIYSLVLVHIPICENIALRYKYIYPSLFSIVLAVKFDKNTKGIYIYILDGLLQLRLQTFCKNKVLSFTFHFYLL